MQLSKVIFLKCVLFVFFVGGATSERAGGHALIHFYLGNGEVDVGALTKQQSENENKIRIDNRCLHFAQKLFLLKMRNYFPKIPYVYVSDSLFV